MNVLVIGSATTTRRQVRAVLDQCWATWGAFHVGTAGAWDVEDAASRWAATRGAKWWPRELIPGHWLDWADVLVAFDAAHSPRTREACDRMRRQGKPIHEYGAKETEHD